MPDYQYIAREMSGQQVSGTLTAASEHDALSALAAKSLFPVTVGLAEDAKAQQQRSSRRVGARYLTAFYTQLSDLLKSGVPLLRSLQLLQDQTSQPALKHVIQDVAEQVADGRRLADSMKQHPKAFGDLAVSMVHAGEEGGFLEDVLKRISAFLDHQEELRARVVGAMVYPAFLTVVGTGIVTFLLVKIVPDFAGLFERLAQQGELPWATTALLSFSDFLQQYWAVIAVGMVAAVFGFIQYTKSESGRFNFDRFRLSAKGMGPIVRGLAISRFCRILGTLLRNGVPILQSLRIAKDATGNVVLSKAISEAADNVSTGRALAQPLSASGHFPREVVEMIAVGEESNNLEQVLIDISDNIERRTSRQLDLFVRLLEPIMLLVMAAIVVFVIAALLLPVMKMSTAF